MKDFIQYLEKTTTKSCTKNDYERFIDIVNTDYNNHYGCSDTFVPYIDKNTKNTYLQWQHDHEVNIYPNSYKGSKIIDVSINSIEDIIQLIDDNPYDETCEYNIDLKMLHNIYHDLKSLNNMVGLYELKKSLVNQLLYFIQKLHIGETMDYKHTVLYGPPGTGKTEIAKKIGNIYSKMGILEKNVFQKVTRGDLIAGYLGQTAIKTKHVIEKSLGGVLFIDEAYSLGDYSQNDSFSKECIDTLCEALSFHRDNLMVIIAGYEQELNDRFFSSNKGLESRFIWRFKIDSYNADELCQIFVRNVKQNSWTIYDISSDWFSKREHNFKFYGRDMDILFTYVKICHGRRIFGCDSIRKHIILQDMDAGYEIFSNNKKCDEKPVLSMYI